MAHLTLHLIYSERHRQTRWILKTNDGLVLDGSPTDGELHAALSAATSALSRYGQLLPDRDRLLAETSAEAGAAAAHMGSSYYRPRSVRWLRRRELLLPSLDRRVRPEDAEDEETVP